MNKLNILVAALMAFAAVAQLARAGETTEELKSELDENEEVDDQLEGGFLDNWKTTPTGARFGITTSSESEYGNDIQLKGQTQPVEPRTSVCAYKKSDAECAHCCKQLSSDATYQFTRKLPAFKLKRVTCVCFFTSTAYEAPTLA